MIKVKLSNWKPDHQMDEAYKALRTNIQFCGADKKVIAFTSCTPNEGKSSVTFNPCCFSCRERQVCTAY